LENAGSTLAAASDDGKIAQQKVQNAAGKETGLRERLETPY
jgi:hypothetical protein